MKRRFLLGMLFGSWILAVAAGFSTLARHAAKPGDPGSPPQGRPVGSRLSFDAERYTLLIFLHPRCPCSRASLKELDRVVARCGRRLAARAVFIGPEGTSIAWNDTGLLHQARAIPGLHVTVDQDGTEARSFGARTSGHVMIFDTRGKLRFSGGITPSRNHEGHGAGRDAVVELVLHDQSEIARTPVFGCPLFAETNGREQVVHARNP
ncbi:MAG: RedB [Isosphaeraceae bacterium]